jgi:hypothetical protein
MKSHPSKKALGSYFDGGLSAVRRAGVEEHLNACEACRHYVQGLESVAAELAALPREIPPPVDLQRPWLGEDPAHQLPGVLQRATRHLSRVQRLGAAAAAVILVAVAASLLLVGGQTTDPDAFANARGDRPVIMLPDLAPGIAARIRSYEAASRQLTALYSERRDNLPSTAVQPVDASLESLDRAIAAVQEAVATHPEVEGIQRMLVQRYEAKIDLLRRALNEQVST